MDKLRELIEDTRRLRVENQEAAKRGAHGRWIDAAYCVCRERALMDAWQAISGKPYSMFQVEARHYNGS